MLLILISTFDLSFAPINAFLLSLLSRIKFLYKFLRSGVVYLFKCRCCSASYVGQTTRHLHTRVSEHLGLTPITGQPSSSPVMSSIFSHLNTTGHSANSDDFKILSSWSDNCELMIHESFLILSSNPLLTSRAALFRSTFCNSSAVVLCLLCLLICIVLSYIHPFILYYPYYLVT